MAKSSHNVALCIATLASSLAVCVAATEIDPKASEIQLLPAGKFRARDGRPEKVANWYIDAALAAKVIAKAEQRQTPYVTDYDHQTLYVEKTGNPAPAAGWFKKLEWREGQGLYAVDVQWTDKAAAHLAAREYRYISPVFSFDTATGDVLEILLAAITNNPALDGMSEVLMAASAKLTPETEDTVMLKALLKLLGLPDTATEAEATAALSALVAKSVELDTATATIATLSSQIAKTGDPDPAKFVPVQVVEDLKTQLAALSTQINDDKVEEMVAEGLAAKKLLPAQKAWATSLGKSDQAALRSYLDTTAPIAVLSDNQTSGKKPGEEGYVASAEEVAVARQLGIDPATLHAQ